MTFWEVLLGGLFGRTLQNTAWEGPSGGLLWRTILEDYFGGLLEQTTWEDSFGGSHGNTTQRTLRSSYPTYSSPVLSQEVIQNSHP